MVGTFRNTYYDFPNEKDFSGKKVKLMSVDCSEIGSVALGFHDAVCVQGSGMLASGTPVSFARRDCECARVCPRTEQKICFEAVDPRLFPWGRGALGKPITPLVTAAVDDSVIAMGTVMYIPEYDGMPRDMSEEAAHDGCFVAEDRGLKVKGKHVDIFTGRESMTRLWNERMPSNQGVTVVLDSPRCARLVRP
jgi:3D (Asp-Asp-Asp) domain-containing protein